VTDIGEVLARELGPSRVIRAGDECLADYGRDESPTTMLPAAMAPPDCAVRCESTAEVATVLRICSERRVPVTPRGAGSGMVGGALPIAGGVVLSTETMQRVIEISEDDLLCVVEPGVITGRL
jgi:glycolate oxidase